jgi:uncharacterized protein YaaR (DUF327 family)
MKIGGNQRPFVEQFGLNTDSRAGEVKSPAFQDLFSKAQANLTKQEMDMLLRQIDDMGKQLSKQMTWKALMEYKERVRRFLQQAVKGFQAREKQGFDRRGRMRLYKILSQIDDIMAELAEMVVREEKEHLDILAKIGDIRGLLVNLYY